MSLLSAILLPKLEKGIIALALEPQIAQFVLNQLKSMAIDIVDWAEKKQELPDDSRSANKEFRNV